ncbi:VOC family protein [Microbacterium sp.]|uniref:VOC family protein n=1 Tax=Microbacterium sp. TaxID=51671 RepID=UPI0028127696|nr:VOC family protein [Microbacterium sp.]
MNVTSVYPVLATTDVAATTDFYRHHFGFVTSFESDWYVSLRLASWELAILHADHPTIPALFRGRQAGGILLNIEVPDVDSVHKRLVAEGLDPVLPLRSEEFGQRHAIFAGPDGVLIDVITPIPPGDGYSEQFSAAALEETRGRAE